MLNVGRDRKYENTQWPNEPTAPQAQGGQRERTRVASIGGCVRRAVSGQRAAVSSQPSAIGCQQDGTTPVNALLKSSGTPARQRVCRHWQASCQWHPARYSGESTAQEQWHTGVSRFTPYTSRFTLHASRFTLHASRFTCPAIPSCPAKTQGRLRRPCSRR